jgi:hypothetical protein
LVEEISRQLESGDSIDLDSYCQQYPSYADQLRQLVPALDILHRVGSLASRKTATDTGPSDTPGGQLGDFRIVSRIGHGGMGVVGLDRKVVSFASCVRLAIGSGRVVRVGKSRRGWCAEERRSSPGGGRGWDVQDWACRRRGDAGRGSRDSSQGINGCGRAPKKRSAAVVPSGRVAR